jgi:hypothetical protein
VGASTVTAGIVVSSAADALLQIDGFGGVDSRRTIRRRVEGRWPRGGDRGRARGHDLVQRTDDTYGRVANLFDRAHSLRITERGRVAVYWTAMIEKPPESTDADPD